MGGFFKSWRRKTGCVTLLMASMFATGWIRSLFVTDSLQLPSRLSLPKFLPKLVSSSDQSVVICFPARPNDDGRFLPSWIVDRFSSNSEFFNHNYTDWPWRSCGFAIGKTTEQVRIFVIPYGSIVVPLTLLSSHLLLIKSRRERRPG
jgi:hypothetical protein